MLEDPSADSHLTPQNLYADIIVPRHVAGSFTYIVPPQLKPILRVGHCVLVPFGRSRIQGAVISLSHALPASLDRQKLREIGSIVTDNGWKGIPSGLLDLAKGVSEYYVAPWGQCLRLVMPPSRARDGRFKLTEGGRETLTAGHGSNEIRSLLERLSKKPTGIKRSTLLGNKGSKQERLLEMLVQKGWIVEDLQASYGVNGSKPPYLVQSSRTELHLTDSDAPPLSDGRMVLPESEERLVIALKNRQPAKLFLQAPLSDRRALLHRAIHHTLTEGRTTLIIVAEVDRARWLAETLMKEGTVVSACLSRGLSDDARAAIWQQARRPDPQVIVGTRSAVFLPLQSLGMIWIERAEDPALKEPQEPRYHARDVAWLRARDEGALLILSSPYPSLEAALNVDAPGTLHQELPVALRPKVEVVDLRPLGKKTVLSPPLIEAVREAIERKAGVLLFLNRKGYASALICRDCGQVPRCQSCRVALAYYRHHGCLSCSYCGTVTTIPNTCASCDGHRLQLIGEGTERVEEEVRRLFADARIIRADGDTMQKPAQAAALWKCIKGGQWDVLIGTQLVLRDYALPPVGLVAAVQADASLSLPHFRAAERTYHLLRDAVALACPSSDGGRVIIQSYLPSHHAIQAVVQQDESIFTSEELSHRIALGYPPAVHLIALHVSGANERLVLEAAAAWAVRLQAVLPTAAARREASADMRGRDVYTVLGPVPPPVPKVRGHYRQQILVKSSVRERGVQAVCESIRQLEQAYPTRAVRFDVDVDPVEMW
jgi:primosomal protein N' (replication factor Y) (superfamily II helicase)